MIFRMTGPKVRRTVTIAPELAEAMDRAIAQGAAPHVSAFVSAAVAAELRDWARERMARQAALLDAGEEVALAQAAGEQPSRAVPWSGLHEG